MSMQTGSVDANGLARTTDGKLYVTLGSGTTLDPSAVVFGAEDTITAFATGGQTNATALSATKSAHRVSVCATAADSVKLPAATAGQAHYLRNDGVASMQVFGQATETIDGVASATGVAQAAGTGAWYVCTTAAKWTRTAVLNPANVSFTGGQISGVSGVTNVLNGGGLPFISLSSGSVAANGAISAITALPRIYPAAWCYFPANILATTIAAGWYYCTFSSTTAGIAFLNTYTSGSASAPASPTAVTDGKGAFTGDTGEEFGLTLSVPILNASSAIKTAINFENTNNANVKTYRVRWSGNAGTIFVAMPGAAVGGASVNFLIQNTGATGNQFSEQIGAALNANPSTTAVLGTVTTSVATTLVFSIQKATATDNAVWYPPYVELAL